MKTQKKTSNPALSVVIVAVLALTAVWYFGKPPVSVRNLSLRTFNHLIKPTLVNWNEKIVVTGSIDVSNLMKLRAQTAGKITNVLIALGQEVKTGDTLYEVSVKDQPTQIAALKSPFSGKVISVIVHLNDYVNKGDILLSLQGDDQFRVVCNIPRLYAPYLQIGDDALLILDDANNTQITAKIYSILLPTSTSDHTVKVRAKLINPPKQLKAGTFAEVHLLSNKKIAHLVIPQDAIIYTPEQNYVNILRDGKSLKVPVTLGEQRDNLVTVLFGLQPSDTVINDH